MLLEPPTHLLGGDDAPVTGKGGSQLPQLRGVQKLDHVGLSRGLSVACRV
jgi:hypothetical protein